MRLLLLVKRSILVRDGIVVVLFGAAGPGWLAVMVSVAGSQINADTGRQSGFLPSYYLQWIVNTPDIAGPFLQHTMNAPFP